MVSETLLMILLTEHDPGLSPATTVVTLITRVIIDYINRKYYLKQIVHVYIDDVIVIGAQSKRKNRKRFEKLIQKFRRLGFLIQDQKVRKPARKQLVLGKFVDTKKMTIEVNKAKDHELQYLFSIFDGEVEVKQIGRAHV